VICQVVRDHYETFVAQAASLRDGEGLPRFVDGTGVIGAVRGRYVSCGHWVICAVLGGGDVA
jgi:hypothetical protein